MSFFVCLFLRKYLWQVDDPTFRIGKKRFCVNRSGLVKMMVETCECKKISVLNFSQNYLFYNIYLAQNINKIFLELV